MRMIPHEARAVEPLARAFLLLTERPGRRARWRAERRAARQILRDAAIAGYLRGRDALWDFDLLEGFLVDLVIHEYLLPAKASP